MSEEPEVEEWTRIEDVSADHRHISTLEVSYAADDTVRISRTKLTRILAEAGYELQEPEDEDEEE